MYDGTRSGPVASEDPPGEETALPLEEPKDSGNNGSNSDCPKTASQFRANLEERLSRHGARPASPVFSASTRRSRFQKPERCEPGNSATHRLSIDASEKSTLTPSMRKKYLKEFLNKSGLSSIVSSQHTSLSKDCEDDDALYGINDTGWALDPMEHAWMLCAMDGNYDTVVEFLAEDQSLLSKKDFISGYTALHWLAKNGKDETLIRLLRHAEKEGLPVNVNMRGSGGLTPLHVAAMHNQYMIVKILVGAFGANIEVMDYSGKRAWQYLKDNAPKEMKELLGAWDEEHTLRFFNMNNSASEAKPIEQHAQEKIEVDISARRNIAWRFGSFRKILCSVGLLEEKS
ncbi:uncharacterized protein sowahd [Misgurnus anguillicaudatus]|uniref:uncharacterized protein sowahd n=1 Tax=Misgurnus anguillicaudatus TaxID=75329 RepID=UPI003CCFD211